MSRVNSSIQHFFNHFKFGLNSIESINFNSNSIICIKFELELKFLNIYYIIIKIK